MGGRGRLYGLARFYESAVDRVVPACLCCPIVSLVSCCDLIQFAPKQVIYPYELRSAEGQVCNTECRWVEWIAGDVNVVCRWVEWIAGDVNLMVRKGRGGGARCQLVRKTLMMVAVESLRAVKICFGRSGCQAMAKKPRGIQLATPPHPIFARQCIHALNRT